MVRDEDLAQDLAQDTFVRAFQSLGSFRGEAGATTWILAIARNLALNRSRRLRLEQRWQRLTDRLPDLADREAVPEPAEPRLTAALATLPSAQREAIVLYYTTSRISGSTTWPGSPDGRRIPSRVTCTGPETTHGLPTGGAISGEAIAVLLMDDSRGVPGSGSSDPGATARCPWWGSYFDQGGTTPLLRAYAIDCPRCSC
jgi:RNA polymerase sigma factor (sigma-70 family)